MTMVRKRRIGIYAGTFDPIHNGHVTFALGAAKVCELDTVVFLPEYEHRNKMSVTDFAQRLAMIELALGDHPTLEVKRLTSRQFSVEHTLPELQRMYPDARLTLLLGSDTARVMSLATWPGLEQMCRTVDLAIGMRQGDTKEDLEHVAKRAKVTYIYTNHPTTAATKVRDGAVGLTHPEVQRYIAANKLYTASAKQPVRRAQGPRRVLSRHRAERMS